MNRWYLKALAVTATVAAVLCTVPFESAIAQTPTRVMIRVVANDAKIIGSGVGGAKVTIVDAENGRVLAQGTQEGSTGDTGRIIREAHRRHASIYDTPGAGAFLAELALEHPTRVQITAEGPLGTPHAMQTVTTTMLLVPGQDVLGDGIVITLHGFTVRLEAPDADGARLRAGESFDIIANVTMLCGCPTEPDGLWDANDITIVARAWRAGHVAAEDTLSFTGTTSTYAARMQFAAPGQYELEVLAMDAAHGNFGQVRRMVEVR